MSLDATTGKTLINGRYRIRQPIGSGGIGQVFYAIDEHLQRPVAVKRLRKDVQTMDRYRDGWSEARALARLQHPNIVTLFEFGEDEEGCFFVMEYIAGETIDHLATRTLFTEKDFLDVARQCLSGLAAAHELGLVHRDIKPTNIMLVQGAAGQILAKILDFGLAKFQKNPEPQTTDHENSLLGSVYFMAPEQFSRVPVDCRADLYALGNVFYYALTGKLAHAAESVEQVIYSHLSAEPLPLPELRPDLSASVCLWVHQLMRKDPLERPQTAAEALQLLDHMQTYVVTSPVQVMPPVKKPSRTGLVAPVLVFLVLAAAAGLWWKMDNNAKLAERERIRQEALQAEELVRLQAAREKAEKERIHVIEDPLPSRSLEPVSEPVVESADKILDPLDGEAVKAAIGQEVLVEGVVVRQGINKSGTILYLNFSENFRSTLTLVFFKQDKPEEFTEANLTPFIGKKIRVRGTVGEYNGAPQIKMDSLDQMVVQE